MSHAAESNPAVQTLRVALEGRRATGAVYDQGQIVAMMVPFITELAERHAEGQTLFVHPSSIVYDPTGLVLDELQSRLPPNDPHDRACLAPEQRAAKRAGDARASVFATGAILYELATGASVGPGMRRPSELVDGITPAFETLLGKALVSDAQHRPADLAALAQALHHCSPMASMPPPAAAGGFEGDDDLMVDVSLSLLPPPPVGGAALYPIDAAQPTPTPSTPDPTASQAGTTQQLTAMKSALEADPRPRYVVIKDGMDHGPFTAVELLQQIASHSFTEDHPLRDTLSTEEKLIAEWEEFAPFALHAGRNRAVKAERSALEVTVVRDRQSSQNKALFGGAALVLIAAAFAGWWFRVRQKDDIRMGVSEDQAQSIDIESGLGKGSKGGGKWVGGGKGSGTGASSGPHPQVAGGSCEAAQSQYVMSYDDGAPPDLTAGAYAGVLGRGTYLNSCGVPSNMGVSICAAVQNGRAVGVTVTTQPPSPGIASCVASQVRGMGFPSHPRLDVTRTFFKPE